jgi:Fur family ferric uptake transcriptional regulator
MSHCQTLIDKLRLQGYRITPQREMIIEALAHSDHHLSAEQIFASVQERVRGVNLATVYRTLDLLIGQGLASRLDLGDGQVVYATSHHGPHIHLVCRQCGHVTDADHELVASLGLEIQSQYGFTADLQHISILGVCSACQS